MTIASRLVGAAVLPLLLTSCVSSNPDKPTPAGPSMNVHVDVDTPQLRALKKQAGVEPCTTRNDGAQAIAGGMPDATLPCLGGGPDVHLGSLRGPTVVNLFAQWCPPCRKELPYYQKLHASAGNRLQVLGIDYLDTQPAQALGLVEQARVTYPLLADPAAQLRVPFRIRGLPLLVMVGKDGRIAYQQFVAIDSYAQLRDLVKKHLGITV